MNRRPEPELMLDADQVRAYAAADFEVPHAHCVDLLLDRLGGLPRHGRAVDLGCGPADISLRLARRLDGWRFVGVDGSPAMLDRAREALAAEGATARIELVEAFLPTGELSADSFDLVFSNSLLHHLSEPAVLWTTLRAVARPGAAVFVMDLLRPESPGRVSELVARYAADEPAVLRRDFEASLYAAYTLAEVAGQLSAAGLERLRLEAVSDRHWIASGHLAPAPATVSSRPSQR